MKWLLGIIYKHRVLMVWFRLFFRDGNLPQENKPLPKEPDERKKTKTPKSKVLSLRDISRCFVSEIL